MTRGMNEGIIGQQNNFENGIVDAAIKRSATIKKKKPGKTMKPKNRKTDKSVKAGREVASQGSFESLGVGDFGN